MHIAMYRQPYAHIAIQLKHTLLAHAGAYAAFCNIKHLCCRAAVYVYVCMHICEGSVNRMSQCIHVHVFMYFYHCVHSHPFYQ